MKIALYEVSDKKKILYNFYPLGLGYIAGYLRKNLTGIEVKIFRTMEELLEWNPYITGLSCMSSNFNIAVETSDTIKKETGCSVFLGGSHISSIPVTLPESCDAGIIGEGEETFLEIVNTFLTKKNPCKHDFNEIYGLALHDGDNVILTKKRELIADLDNIPYPSRDWKNNISNGWSFTSRGCPYNCVFCFSSLFWDKCRMNSPEYVVGEIQELMEIYDHSHHAFLDDLFSANPERMRRIGILIREKISSPMRFTATARANLVNEKMGRLFADFGVDYVHMGLESGSDRILKFLKHDDGSVQQNQNALDIFFEYGVKPVGTFIIGSPGETEEDLEKTYLFIKKNLKSGKLSSFSFGPLIPFPGTKIWEYAVTNGFIDPCNVDWGSLDIDVRNFDREKYVLLSGDIEEKRFCYYFEKIKDMLQF